MVTAASDELNGLLTLNVHDPDRMTSALSYYVYVMLMLLPTYLFFKLWMWMGWELYVNNWKNVYVRDNPIYW